MICAWNELLSILPNWLRPHIEKNNRQHLEEIRLRVNSPPELCIEGQNCFLPGKITVEELRFCINCATRYSPWAASTVNECYITAPGGHRIGICGEAILHDGVFDGIREVSSICIRVAHDLTDMIPCNIPLEQNYLIIGAPGWGKTTLLRDLIRRVAEIKNVCVIDERHELFPNGFQPGKHMDVLSGCPKAWGINSLLRTMHPQCIAVDEITALHDSESIRQAAFSGVQLIATAHASGMMDYRKRPVYAVLRELNVFQQLIVLHQDKHWHMEAA